MNNKMFISYAPDDNYTNLTVISMVSVIENNKNKEIEFIILYSELSDKNIEKFRYFNSKDNCTVRFVKIDETLFDGLPISSWVTIQAWFRVVAPIQCSDIDKMLYLDCDTLVNNSLEDLWNIDLGDNYLAAVKDVVRNDEHIKRLKMKSDSYFNSGVLLINCKKFRDEKVLEQIKDIVNSNKYKIKFCDQDTLNLISDNKKINLPMKYNYMEVWWHNFYYEYFGQDEKLYLEARENPIIIHISGLKPNFKGCKHSQRDNWWHYAELSNIYEELKSGYDKSTLKEEQNSILKKIFSLKSAYRNNKKWKVLTLLGIKVKFNISKHL